MVHRPLVPTSWFSRRSISFSDRSSLAEALDALFRDREFFRLLTPIQIEEFRSLCRERDPALLAEAVLGWGNRLAQGGQIEAAIELFRSSGACEGPLQGRIENRLNALLGRGPVENRLEDLVRRFVSQAADPAMLLSFAVAGGLAGWVRRASLASLAMRGGGLMTRGLGARVMAGAAAYLAEVPAFVATHRLSRGLISDSRDVGFEPSFSQELAGAGIFLGCLKLSGFLSSALLGRLTRNPALQVAGTSLGSLGGVYLGHRVQEQAGLRPVQDEANRWVDSIDAWLQMMVGGRLLRADPRGAILETRLSSYLARDFVNPSVGVSAGRRFDARMVRRPVIAASFEEAALRREARTDLPARSAPETQALVARYGEAEVRGFIYDLEACARLLGHSSEHLQGLAVKSNIRDPEILQSGWARLHYMLRHSDPEGRHGHYLNWIARLGAMSTVERGRIIFLDLLFDELHRGTSLSVIERRLALVLPDYDLFSVLPQIVGSRSTPAEVLNLGNFRRVQTLPLSEEAREVLRRYLRSLNDVTPQALAELETLLRDRPTWQIAMDEALVRARRSPLAGLRIERLLRVVEPQDRLLSKVFELADDDAAVLPFFLRDTPLHSELPTFASQIDAYMGDSRISNQLFGFFGSWAEAKRPVLRTLRRTQTLDAIREVVPSPRPVNREDLISILGVLNDFTADSLQRALRTHDFHLRILEDSEFEALARRLHGDDRGELWTGFTIRGDASYPQNQVVIRQVRNASPTVFPELVFERLVTLVHEYEHHAHPVLTADSPQEALLREEMSAHLRHLHFRARLGFPESIEEILRIAPLGLGIYLRDHIESAYLRRSAGASAAQRPTEPPPGPARGGGS